MGAYDNAMAESVIGLYKAEVIRHEGPSKGLDGVEFATLEWVDWFNNTRLLEADRLRPSVRVRADVLCSLYRLDPSMGELARSPQRLLPWERADEAATVAVGDGDDAPAPRAHIWALVRLVLQHL